jgi:hypothetical protein
MCLLLAACGGSHSSTTTRASAGTSASAPAAPATSSTVPVTSADGAFQAAIPPGFQDVAGLPSAVDRVYAAAAPRMAIDVVRASAGAGETLDSIATQGLAGLKRSNPADHDFSGIEKLTVGGVPARGFTHYGVSERGAPAVYAQLYVLHGSSLYGIAATAPPSAQTTLRQALDQVLASWRWMR